MNGERWQKIDEVFGCALELRSPDERRRKEPERRYGSVEQLAEDVKRHLRNLPVHARPDTLGYRAGKLLRRHREGAAMAALAFLLTGGFLFALLYQSEILDRERRHTEEVARDLTGILTADPEQAAAHRLAATEVLDVAVPRLRAEVRDPSAEAALLDALGQVYHQAGLSHTARDLMEESLALREETEDADRRALSNGLHNLGAVVTSLGEVERGATLLNDALTVRKDLWGEEHAGVAETKEALALARWTAGDYAGAETLLLEAIETRDSVCPVADNYWVTESMSHLSALYARTGRLPEAERLAVEARSRRRAFGDHLPDRARSLDEQAHLHFVRGELEAAEDLYREVLEIRRSLAASKASVGQDQRALARSLHDLARCLGERGDYEEAERYFNETLAMTRRLGEDDTPETATLLNNLAVVLGNKGEHAAAEALFHRVLDLRLRFFGEEHPHVAQARYSLGQLFHGRGDFDAAERLYRRAAAGLASTLPEDHPAWAYPQVAMGRLLLDRGRPLEAEGVLRGALERLEESHHPGHWRIADAESLLGGSLAAQGRFTEAEELLRRSYVVLQTQRSARAPRTRRALSRLADLYRSREGEQVLTDQAISLY